LEREPLLTLINLYCIPIDENPTDTGIIDNKRNNADLKCRAHVKEQCAAIVAARGMHPRGELSTPSVERETD
jgi:hypothetical protein